MGNPARNFEIAQAKRDVPAQSSWDEIATSKKFQDLMATKKIFIVPAFIFFMVSRSSPTLALAVHDILIPFLIMVSDNSMHLSLFTVRVSSSKKTALACGKVPTMYSISLTTFSMLLKRNLLPIRV